MTLRQRQRRPRTSRAAGPIGSAAPWRTEPTPRPSGARPPVPRSRIPGHSTKRRTWRGWGLIADQHQDPPPTDNSDNWRSHRVSGIGCMVVGASAVGYGGRFVLVQYRSLSKSEAVNAGDCTVRSTHGLTEEFSPRGVSRSEAGSVSFVGRHGPAIAASARSPPALGTSRRSAGPRSTLPARIAAPAIGQGSARRPRFPELNHVVGQDQLFV